MFLRLSITSYLRQDFGLTAGSGDLSGRLAAELVRPNRQRLRDLAAREHLDSAGPADEPALAKSFRRHFRAGLELLAERIEVHHLEFLAEGVVEPALRHPAVQGHLPAFEPALVVEAGTRLRAFVAPSGLNALARPLAASDALLRVRRALWGTQIAE